MLGSAHSLSIYLNPPTQLSSIAIPIIAIPIFHSARQSSFNSILDSSNDAHAHHLLRILCLHQFHPPTQISFFQLLMFQIGCKRENFGQKGWLIFVYLILSCTTFIHGNRISQKVLRVGEELFREMLPLQNGARLYQLQGLKPHTWYEVKISYPASIPSSFTLQVSRGIPDLTHNRGRKLLNTEKLIFKTDGIISLSDQSEMSVLVNVESEGFVAAAGKREQEYAIFNIVCDELLLGIPHQAWYVVVVVLFCLMFAFAVPPFLPLLFMPKKGTPAPINKQS